MRIIVTGASGFVGAAIVKELADRGNHVVACDRSHPSRRLLEDLATINRPVEHFRIDVGLKGEISALFDNTKPDVVIHAAAQTSLSQEAEQSRPQPTLHTNIIGSANVLVAAAQAGTSRVVNISSAGVFAAGESCADPIGETAFPEPDGVYEITKYAAELLWRRLASLNDISSVTARIAQPYGPYERGTHSRTVLSPVFEWFDAARSGGPVVVPNWPVAKDWTYVEDIARAVAELAMADSLNHDLYHVGCGRLWPASDIVAYINERYPMAPIVPVDDPRLVNPNLRRRLPRGPLSIARISSEVGFEPRYDLKAGLAAYDRWLDRELT